MTKPKTSPHKNMSYGNACARVLMMENYSDLFAHAFVVDLHSYWC